MFNVTVKIEWKIVFLERGREKGIERDIFFRSDLSWKLRYKKYFLKYLWNEVYCD